MAFLVQGKPGLEVPAVTKLKEYHIMCAEELSRNQSVRKIASTFDVDESTLRYRLGGSGPELMTAGHSSKKRAPHTNQSS